MAIDTSELTMNVNENIPILMEYQSLHNSTEKGFMIYFIHHFMAFHEVQPIPRHLLSVMQHHEIH